MSLVGDVFSFAADAVVRMGREFGPIQAVMPPILI